MANSNERENEPTNKEVIDELVKKSHELREKHKKTQELYDKLKERTKNVLNAEKN